MYAQFHVFRIAEFLRSQGFKVAKQNRSEGQSLKEVASKIKKAKVFIGCLSDQYVANAQTKMVTFLPLQTFYEENWSEKFHL